MSATYDLIVSLARAHAPPPARLLDFGCGRGEVVERALAAGYEAQGVDSYAGPWEQYAAAGLRERVHKVAPGAALPFADASFDVVLTNQVVEHLRAPGPAIGELARVLRPGGVLVAIFPTAEMLVEPHLKVPFVHWLPPGSPAQARALRLAHRLGAGAGAGEGWVSGALHGLREEIFYRPVGDSIALFAGHFQLVARGEAAFLRHRLAGSRLRALAPLAEAKWLAPLMRALCVRLANAVLVFRRA